MSGGVTFSRARGKLLKELAREQGGTGRFGFVQRGDKPSVGYAAALGQTGISRQTASRYQALAEIPAQEFENALSDHALGSFC
jgi:hypothetical protein